MKEFWTNFTQGYDGSGDIGSASWQILLMLLGAFVLGYLLRYFMGRGRSGKDKIEIEELRASNKRLRDDLDAVKKKTANADELGSVRTELDQVRRKNRSLEKDLLTAGSAAPGIASASDQTAEIDALKRTNDRLNGELEDCRKRASSAGVTPMATAAVSTSKPANPDDLTKIEGVGKKIQEHMNNGGVWSFDQLAKTSISRLQEILDAAGPAYTMHDPGTWPKQGGLARDGNWEKLEKWQAELKGGRKRKKR